MLPWMSTLKPRGKKKRSQLTPNKPSADPKISTTRIFTNSVELAASERAAEEPTTPTQRPQARFAHPVVSPAASSAYPLVYALTGQVPSGFLSTYSILVWRMMATMTP